MSLGALPQPHIRTAHDVRHLAACTHCGDLGDDRVMVAPLLSKSLYHGRCYVARFGLTGLLNLPKVQANKLTLGDIGPKAARALLDHWDACGRKAIRKVR